jgi:peptidoglycan/xylan/chitin deacetylase (PgdA/CDA1 family)
VTARRPSPPARAAALAALATIALLAVAPRWAPLPFAALAALLAAAPLFPRWAFYLPIACRGARGDDVVALTFDDGPDPRALPPLLGLLAEARAPSTFFVVGRKAAAHPEALRAAAAAGHELANHSDTHDPFLALRSTARVRGEVDRCQAAVSAVAARPRFFRPPVGIASPQLRGALAEEGLRCVAWSCRGLDFGNRRLRGLARRVLRRVRGGDVILLHDALPRPEALDPWLAEVRAVLDGLRARGLRVVPLAELLGPPRPSATRGEAAP